MFLDNDDAITGFYGIPKLDYLLWWIVRGHDPGPSEIRNHTASFEKV